MLKIFKNNTARKVTKYFKYQEQDFIQPILSEDGSLGGSNFAVSASSYSNADVAPWKAFDGNNNTHFNFNGFTSGCSYIIYNPTPITINRIIVRNKEDDEHYISSGQILCSNDNSQWVIVKELFTNEIKAVNATWTIEINTPKPYKYYKIVVLTGVNNVGFSNLTLEAKIKTAKEVSKNENYDYFKTELIKNSGWADIQREKKYYKKQIIENNGKSYAKLDFIECNGTQHLATSYNPNPAKTKLEYRVEFTNISSTQNLWCARTATNADSWTCFLTNGKFRCDYGTKQENIDISASLNTEYKFVYDKNILTVNNIQAAQFDQADFSPGILVFMSSYVDDINSSIQNYGNYKLYGAKIWEDDILIKDYIPVQEIESGSFGLYDTINNDFLSDSTHPLLGGYFLPALEVREDEAHDYSIDIPKVKLIEV